MILYRPVGLKELLLVMDSGFSAWPPRLYWQPIFYPVLNEEYAIQIAREWNTKDFNSDFCGYVTRFEVDDDYVKRFKPQIVGDKMHEELWVPSEELETFNQHIIGKIEVLKGFFGTEFTGYSSVCEDAESAEEQILNLISQQENPEFSLSGSFMENRKAYYVNCALWVLSDEYKLKAERGAIHTIVQELKKTASDAGFPLLEEVYYTES